VVEEETNASKPSRRTSHHRHCNAVEMKQNISSAPSQIHMKTKTTLAQSCAIQLRHSTSTSSG
jgi:hypothetical protein